MTISASSIIPFVLTTFILTPILTIIWSRFVVVSLLGIVYTIALLLGLYNEELKLQGNLKTYYYSVNVGILTIILYISLVSLFETALMAL